MEKVKKLYVALVVLFLYAPIGVLVAQSFNASRYRGHWTGFTLQWYASYSRMKASLTPCKIPLPSVSRRRPSPPSWVYLG